MKAATTLAGIAASRVGMSREAAVAEGLSDAAIELLDEAGLILPEGRVPWEPTTLAHCDWIGWMAEKTKMELAFVKAQAKRLEKQLEAQEEFFRRHWAAKVETIVAKALPKRRDGSYVKKSVDLTHVRVTLRARKAGWRVVDDKPVLDELNHLWEDHQFPAELESAVYAKTRIYGDEALRLSAEGEATDLTLLKTDFVAWLTGPGRSVDPETGELFVRDFPGVMPVEEGEDVVFALPKPTPAKEATR